MLVISFFYLLSRFELIWWMSLLSYLMRLCRFLFLSFFGMVCEVVW